VVVVHCHLDLEAKEVKKAEGVHDLLSSVVEADDEEEEDHVHLR